jgi:hypothetical protein
MTIQYKIVNWFYGAGILKSEGEFLVKDTTNQQPIEVVLFTTMIPI